MESEGQEPRNNWTERGQDDGRLTGGVRFDRKLVRADGHLQQRSLRGLEEMRFCGEQAEQKARTTLA
jgi:hypothetical protein